ncbi:MAG: ASKHA domain-containing protein, partial [Chloroflexota bacterium]
MKFQITFLPQSVITHAPSGTTLFNAANWVGLAIDSTCGGRGTCGKCKVRLVSGVNSTTESDHRFLSDTEIADGWRLSCRAVVHADCVADVPRLMANPKAALLGYGRHVALNPNVTKISLRLSEPTLSDQRSDLRRVYDALRDDGYEVRADPAVWRALPKTLRAHDFAVTAVVCGDELIAVEGGDTTDTLFGLALDIGTTTVVGALVNLNSGAVVAVQSALNSQASFGADVISRVSHTMMEGDGLAVLHARVVETIGSLLSRLLAASGVVAEHVYEVVAVGNATMLHLLLGIDPEPIAVAPFIPTIEQAVTLPVSALTPDLPSDAGRTASPVDDETVNRRGGRGLRVHPQARLTTLPHLGAYVGADIVAGVLATGLARSQDAHIRLYIDVGTNGEIVLGSSARTVATAAPAGPAFEGAQIKCGMRASDGAIEGVRIGGDVHLQIIGGNVPPIGICGSGLVDAVAELVKCGIVDASGRMARAEDVRGRLPDALVERIITVDGIRAFLLSSPQQNIYLTQPDIRALQFAKGAIAA